MVLNGRQTSFRTNWQKCPNSSQCSQMVLNIRHTSEPTGKNSQIALALTNARQWQIDIRTNWQECPNIARTHRWEWCLCAHQRTYLALELISSTQMQSSMLPRKSVSWQPVLRGETGRILKTNDFCSC